MAKDKITPDVPRPTEAVKPPEAARAEPAKADAARPAAAPGKAFDAAAFARKLFRYDVVLVALTLVFAFLVAAFPVSNSDFFREIAVGRLVAHGDYAFGKDPFTFTADTYWANHSWLFGLLLFALYTLPGGAVLVVVFKAVLVLALAAVMLHTARRPGQRLWLPAVCCLFALLALSPRLQLQSVVVSYLFLALTLALLTDFLRSGGTTRRVWLIPVLVVLWVNLDAWFFLGPLTVALFAAGCVAQVPPANRNEPSDALPQARRRQLALVLLASVAACFASPHHYHAVLNLPAPFTTGPAKDALADDDQFAGLFASPFIFDRVYYSPTAGLSVAGLAFFPLLIAAIVSFVRNRGLVWWRLFVFVPFVLLAVASAHAIPFFAVVAGPIASLNFLDAAARRARPVPTHNQRNWMVTGRVLTALVAVVLVCATVAGWPQAAPWRDRSVGFRVVEERSLKQAALYLGGLGLADKRYFNTNPEVVNYVAWFAPEWRGFLDQRLHLFNGAAKDYTDVRRSLAEAWQGLKGGPRWRKPLGERGMQVVVFYEPDMIPRGDHFNDLPALRFVLALPEEWPPLFLGGRASVFAWRSENGARLAYLAGREGLGWAQPFVPLPFADREIDADRLAFGPDAVQAPGKWPEPPAREWYQTAWHAIWRPEAGPTSDAEEARLLTLQFLSVSVNFYELEALRVRLAGVAAAAGLGVPATVGGACPVALVRLVNQLHMTPGWARPQTQAGRALSVWDARVRESHWMFRDVAPPALLYRALRAARRAVADSPGDADSWLVLAQAYKGLTYQTAERSFAPVTVALIRRAQLAAAARNAVQNDPDLQPAHALLWQHYDQIGYFDLMVKHRRASLECQKELQRRFGPQVQPGETAEGAQKRLENEEKLVKDVLEKELKRRQDQYLLTAANRPKLERALIALGKHERYPGQFLLAEKAREALEQIDSGDSKRDIARGALEQFDLYFNTGNLKDARANLTPEVGALLSAHPLVRLRAYEWYQLLLAAAAGDYDEADAAVESLREKLDSDGNMAASALMAENVKQFLLQQATVATERVNVFGALMLWMGAGGPPLLGEELRAEGMMLVRSMSSRQADLRAIQGWLALERGDNEKARDRLQKALLEWWPPSEAVPSMLVLGSGSALEAVIALRAGWYATIFPQAPFGGHQLAVIGLRWLDANAKGPGEGGMK
jgi:hypothetical protein